MLTIDPVEQHQRGQDPVGCNFEHRPMFDSVGIIGDAAIASRAVEITIAALDEAGCGVCRLGLKTVDYFRLPCLQGGGHPHQRTGNEYPSCWDSHCYTAICSLFAS